MPRARCASVRSSFLIVGDDLVHDAFDGFGGVVGCVGGQDVDRHGGQADLAGSEGTALAVAHGDHAVVAAHRCDGDEHSVLAETGQELLAQIDAVPDIVANLRVPRGAVRHVRGEPPTICRERMLHVSVTLAPPGEDWIWPGTDTMFAGCVTELGSSRIGYFRRPARFTAMR